MLLKAVKVTVVLRRRVIICHVGFWQLTRVNLLLEVARSGVAAEACLGSLVCERDQFYLSRG